MGLSNPERIAGMYWSVHHLSEACRNLKSDSPISGDRLEHIRDLGDQLWHGLLRGESNSAFWILGGALTSGVRGPYSPWGVAIGALCEGARQPQRHWKSDFFDPFEGFLDVLGLLSQADNGQFCRDVFLIYHQVESLVYSLRRYDDRFREKFSCLDKLCSDLFGACFAVMQAEDSFAKAYVGNRICRWIYGQWEGQMWEALNAVNMHHDLSRFMLDCSLAEVIAWDKWRLTHKDCPQNRLVLALRMAGRRFHYAHKLRDLMDRVKGLGVRKGVLEREFSKCLKAHSENETKFRQDHVNSIAEEENEVIHGDE